MLFCVHITLRPVDSHELPELLDRLVEEWEMLVDLTANGCVRACGKIARERGAIAIFDCTSRTELTQILERLPLARYSSSMEVISLIPLDQALAIARRSRAMAHATH